MGINFSTFVGFLFLLLCAYGWGSDTERAINTHPQVFIETDLGNFTVELYPDKAPVTVANFLHYVKTYHYHGTLFHRVIKGFMIQAGGYGFDLYPREPGDPIINESSNGLKNTRGTIAMARTSDPDSARAQFFINAANNTHLDYRKGEPGYTVFGKVVSGMDVVDKISRVPVKRQGAFKHLPKEPVMLLKATAIDPQKGQPDNDQP